MKRTFPFALVDAFTDKALGGNPCAIVFAADSLSEEEMLQIAKEMNQSETSFLLTPKGTDLKARYFTPEREIPLAGHPTIATVHAALEKKLITPKTELSLELKDGPIKVEVHGSKIKMFQRKPKFLNTHDPKALLPIFNLTEGDLHPNSLIQTVSTGTAQLMVFLKSKEALKKLQMDAEKYKAYRASSDFFSPHFFVLEGEKTFARHLGVAPDTAEDPFTGSATGNMAAYLWKHGFLKNPKFIAEQGHWMWRPGSAEVEILGPRENIESVTVAGTAVTVIQGELKL